MKKALSLALALALCMGLFSGCGTETGSNSTSQPAQSSGETVKTVTWASTSDITGLDPRNGNSTITASILASLYSTLVKTDPQGQIVCDAAESYEQVDDTTWHFTLRQDVYFTNGTQMTADDVAYTINSLRDSEKHYALSGDFSFMQVEVLGDFEFNIITDYAFPSLPLRLNYIKIVPSAYVEEVGDEGFAAAPIGSGPFKFVSWEKDQKVVLEKNPDYYGEVPQIDQLVFRVIPEAADRVAALQAGEVDIICNIPTTQAEYLESLDGISVVGQPSTRVVWLQFNLVGGPTPLDDVRVRQAINYAVDRDALIAGVLDGYAVKVASISTPEYEGYDPNVQGYTYDVEKAKQLMADAGYADGFDIEWLRLSRPAQQHRRGPGHCLPAGSDRHQRHHQAGGLRHAAGRDRRGHCGPPVPPGSGRPLLRYQPDRLHWLYRGCPVLHLGLPRVYGSGLPGRL